MKGLMAVLMTVVFCFLLVGSPALLEARGFGGGGHGGGFHGGFHGGSGFHGGFSGHPGGFHGGGFHRGPHHGFFVAAPFIGFGTGLLAGYWLNGYYYTYPYNGACQRWVPTGGYHIESRQDPNTGVWNAVEVPDGYWETVPCY